MMDVDALAGKAAATFVAEVTKGVATPVVDWIGQKLGRTVAMAGADIKAGRESGAAKKKLEGELRAKLEEYPELTEELRGLLERPIGHYAPQIAIAGDGGTITQVQGNNNGVGRKRPIVHRE